jgi:hypothetical protein
MIPAMEASLAASTRLRAQLNCLRVLAALSSVPKDGTGKPIEIGDLKLPSEATIDPYNGESLRMRDSGGWLVYAVGPNGIDDGGMIRQRREGDYLDVGLGPSDSK